MALLITPGFISDSWAATQFKYTAALTSTPHINTTQVSYSYTYLTMQMPHILRITSSNILLWGIIQHEEGSTLNLSLSMSIQMTCNVLNHSQKKKKKVTNIIICTCPCKTSSQTGCVFTEQVNKVFAWKMEKYESRELTHWLFFPSSKKHCKEKKKKGEMFYVGCQNDIMIIL